MADDWNSGLWAAASLVTPMAIRVAATLRLADHLSAGTRTVAELAAAVQADPAALERLMNHLVAAGVLTPAYGLTTLGEGLLDDDIRPWLDLEGSIGRADLSLVELLHTVRTGEPAFPRHFGRPFWADLTADPARAAHFDDLMGTRLAESAPVVAAAYPWGALGSVADLGGGDGSLLIALLRAHDGLRGTVLELPTAVAAAERTIAAAGLTDRCDVRAGTFFDPLPAGMGGFLLSGVLHNWSDADARRILRNCTAAGGRIFVVDPVGGPPDTEGDLRMLGYFGGRERTLEQLAGLAASIGLEVGEVTPAGFRSIIELRPAPHLELVADRHGAALLRFERDNREFFARSISDRGDDYFARFAEQHAALLAEQDTGRVKFHLLIGDDGGILGRFNLYDLANGGAELGYRVAERATGRGLAKLGVRAVSARARDEYGLQRLTAVAARDNAASLAVLRATGFRPVGEREVGGRPGLVHQLDLS